MIESLASQARTGARWMSVAVVVLTLISLGQTIFLSRVLEKRELGLVGMVWAVLGLAQMLQDMGLGNAIVQAKDIPGKTLSTLFWLSAAGGLVLFMLAWASGQFMVWYFREPALAGLTPLAGLSFLLQALAQVFQAVAQRAMRFRNLAWADILTASAGLVITTVLALRGWGAQALLLGGAFGLVARVAFLAIGQRDLFWPELYCVPGQATHFLKFGGFQMLDRCVNYLSANLDYILIGRYWGAEPLAVYRIAYETALRPLAIVNPIFNSVAHPIFSRLQDDHEALRRGLEQGLRVIGALAFPMMAGMAVTADWTVRLLYGEKWDGAVEVLRILCLLGALRCVVNLTGVVLLSQGLARRSCSLMGVMLGFYAIAYAVGLRWGLESMAWAANFALLAWAVLTYHWVYGSSIGMPLGRYLKSLLPSLSASIVMLIALAMLRQSGWLQAWHWREQFAVFAVLGAIIYCGLSFWWNREGTRAILAILGRR